VVDSIPSVGSLTKLCADAPISSPMRCTLTLAPGSLPAELTKEHTSLAHPLKLLYYLVGENPPDIELRIRFTGNPLCHAVVGHSVT
jgi:hypothetical protein